MLLIWRLREREGERERERRERESEGEREGEGEGRGRGQMKKRREEEEAEGNIREGSREREDKEREKGCKGNGGSQQGPLSILHGLGENNASNAEQKTKKRMRGRDGEEERGSHCQIEKITQT